jgi:hypothetical protein
MQVAEVDGIACRSRLVDNITHAGDVRVRMFTVEQRHGHLL